MTDQTNAGTEVSGEDTAAVLMAASGEKAYLPEPQPEPEVEPAGEETPGDDATAAQPEPEAAPQPKPKQTAKERIDELTWRLRETERREAALLDRLSGKQEPAPEAHQNYEPQGDGRPVREDYADDFEFIEALTDWKAEQAAERLVAHQRQKERVSTVQSNFETRAKTLFPEGETEGLQAFRQLPMLPVAVLEIVSESDVGPKIAEHLGDNPAELRRLEGMNPIQQARALTLIEARLSVPVEAPKQTPKTTTDAPEPPPQARGAGGRYQVAADTSDFAAFEKQYVGR